MLPLLWLAFSAPPLSIAEPPVPVLQPVVAQRLVEPPRCLAARCASNEWRIDAMAQIPAGQRRLDGDDLPGYSSRALRFSQSRRDWLRAQGSNARVGVQYGMHALKTPDTQLSVAVGTGYRLQGYADDGMAGTGLILRGRVEWQQMLGERAHLSQTTRVETGQRGTYLRNSLLFNLKLQPDLTLSSGVELRRDSDIEGRNRTDTTLKLRYVF